MKGIQERCSELTQLTLSKFPELNAMKVYKWTRKQIIDKGYKGGEEYVKDLINKGTIPVYFR